MPPVVTITYTSLRLASMQATVQRFLPVSPRTSTAIRESKGLRWTWVPMVLQAVDRQDRYQARQLSESFDVRDEDVLPVAILGTADFDVTTVDVASIRMAGVQPNRSGLRGCGDARGVGCRNGRARWRGRMGTST